MLKYCLLSSGNCQCYFDPLEVNKFFFNVCKMLLAILDQACTKCGVCGHMFPGTLTNWQAQYPETVHCILKKICKVWLCSSGAFSITKTFYAPLFLTPVQLTNMCLHFIVIPLAIYVTWTVNAPDLISMVLVCLLSLIKAKVTWNFTINLSSFGIDYITVAILAVAIIAKISFFP